MCYKQVNNYVKYFFSFFEKMSYRRLFVLILGICIFYVLPILLANTYYIDDMNRTTEGYDWNRDGRFVSSMLMHYISMQHEIVYSLFPYSTILSAFVLATSGFLLAFYIGVRNRFYLLISSVLLLTNPFSLEILTYKFDCLPISLSVFCSVLPFFYYNKNKLKFFVASVLCLYLVFGLYQTTAFSYVMILCFFGIKDVWSFRIKNLLFYGVLAFLAFIFTFFLYKTTLGLLNIHIVDSQRGEFILSDSNFKNLLLERWNGYKSLLFSLLDSSYRYFFYIATLVSVLGLISFFVRLNKSKITVLQIGLTIILVTFLLLLSISINLIVFEARWSPRSLMGYSFVVMLLFFGAIQLPEKFSIVAKLSFLPLIYYSFLIVSQYGIFLKNQDEFSDFMISLIAPDLLKHENLKLVIDGRIQYAPRNETVHYGTMPIIYRLAPLYENYSFYWGIIRTNKFGMISNTYVFGEEREKVLSNKENLPMVQQNKYYSLRIQPPYAILEFYKK